MPNSNLDRTNAWNLSDSSYRPLPVDTAGIPVNANLVSRDFPVTRLIRTRFTRAEMMPLPNDRLKSYEERVLRIQCLFRFCPDASWCNLVSVSVASAWFEVLHDVHLSSVGTKMT
ncbi:unnamed protein product [Echinostoma caproni]|uniref:Uncharacterized protein n=1 Tax=Echinostoma caproni TaxID=27848 RepID=A0A183A7T8_9TREM|nr:unnamed protein product [Echinostoma caproni]